LGVNGDSPTHPRTIARQKYFHKRENGKKYCFNNARLNIQMHMRYLSYKGKVKT
jgi:hypothetical protein